MQFTHMNVHTTDWAEMVYELVEAAVPGSSREREIGEFYSWQGRGREAQLYCLDETTVVLLTMGQYLSATQFPSLAMNVRKSDVTESQPDEIAFQIYDSIS